MKFKELSYANDTDPLFKRLVIRTVENLSGRNKYVKVYRRWRTEVVGKSDRIFSRMLEMIDIDLAIRGNWPPRDLPDTPIVMVANHAYGIADGIAVLALAGISAAVFGVPGSRAQAQGSAEPAATPVSVATVVRSEVAGWEEVSGRLEAVERVDIRSRVAGTIQAVHFREGALVKKGELLLTIDPAPYAAEVARAEAQVAAAQARSCAARAAPARPSAVASSAKACSAGRAVGPPSKAAALPSSSWN